MGTNLMPPSTTGGQSTVNSSVAGGDEVQGQLESSPEKRDVSGSTVVGQEMGTGEYQRQ